MTIPSSHQYLDHGFVRPILDLPSDLTVVNAARVSFSKRSDWERQHFDPVTRQEDIELRVLSEADTHLISYLARHNHWTPFAHVRTLCFIPFDILDEISADLINTGGFEIDYPGTHRESAALSLSLAHLATFPMFRSLFQSTCPISVAAHPLTDDPLTDDPSTFTDCGIPALWPTSPHLTPVTLHLKLPIFVARQLMRSNVGIVYNEVSRRYVDAPPEFHTPTTWRSRPSKSIKQGSGPDFSPDKQTDIAARYCLSDFDTTYNHLLTKGVAPEQARIVLPLSTYTELWATASLRTWARILCLRLHPHAQHEIRQLASLINTTLTSLHPDLWPSLLGDPPS